MKSLRRTGDSSFTLCQFGRMEGFGLLGKRDYLIRRPMAHKQISIKHNGTNAAAMLPAMPM